MNLRAMFVGAAVASVLAVGGCGGGDDHSSSTAASTGTTRAETSQAQSGGQKGAETTSDSAGSASGRSFTLGSPADVPRSEGGDNSIQDFGSEASRADRAAAGRALADYYEALAKGDTEEACALLTSPTRQGIERTLEQLRTQGGSGNALNGCPQALELTVDAGSRGSPSLRLSEVLSLRQQEDQAFLIYRAGDGKVYSMPMGLEGADWRVGGVSAAPLAA
jgi:hypothetical protein